MAEPVTANAAPAWDAGMDVHILEFLENGGFAPRVIYDVGASNGSWTLPVSQVFPTARYELFEPQSQCNEAYQWGLKRVLDTLDANLHTCALSDADGTAAFNIMGDRGVGSSLLGGQSRTESIEVDLRRLDDLVEQKALPLPDLIKMDIQGGELAALMGGRDLCLPHASILALELWMYRGYGPETPLMVEVSEFLRRENFFPFEMGDEYRSPDGRLATKDVWFVRADSDISQAIWGSNAFRR